MVLYILWYYMEARVYQWRIQKIEKILTKRLLFETGRASVFRIIAA